jgi:hypothetical protein
MEAHVSRMVMELETAGTILDHDEAVTYLLDSLLILD